MKPTLSLPDTVRVLHRCTPPELRIGMQFKVANGTCSIMGFAALPDGSRKQRKTVFADLLDEQAVLTEFVDFLMECQVIYWPPDEASKIPEVGTPSGMFHVWASEITSWNSNTNTLDKRAVV